MKKSKVLIPAMALLLFSTAASITGTVAWFTSTRVFNTEAGEFTVSEIDGNMDVTLTGGVATSAVKDNDQAPGENEKATKIKVDARSYLIDASLDATNSSTASEKTIDVYRLTGNSATYQWKVATYAALAGLSSAAANDIALVAADETDSGAANYYKYDGSAWAKQTSGTYGEKYHLYTRAASGNNSWLYRTIGAGETANKYYLAASWTMQFNYTFNAESTDLHIFLDTGMSSFVETHTVTGSQINTGLGFRIAFIAGDSVKVWGNRSLGAEDHEYDNIKHVSGAGDKQVSNYSEDNYLVTKNSSIAPSVADQADHSDIKEHIATIPYPSSGNTSSVTVTCVAWFEGTDPVIVTNANNVFQTLGARMSFFGRSAAPASSNP